MIYSTLDLVVVGAATLGAGAVNSLAGGGTLISFPALLAIGVPALPANVTNTVALCPGYLSGTWAQREDLRGQEVRSRWLAGVAVIGALAGSALLELTPEKAFQAVVPWLLVVSCVLLAFNDRVRRFVLARTQAPTGEGAGLRRPPVALMLSVFVAAVYGGFFGAGLGILLLALLGLFVEDVMARTNAVKQLLQLTINVLAAGFFAFSGHVRWEVVPVMGVAGLVGGTFGGRLAQVVDATWLRRFVILLGVSVAIEFWVSH